MPSFRIHTLTCSPKHILMVFYTDAKAYQFRVVTHEGLIFKASTIYYTKNAAEKAARVCVIEQNLSEKFPEKND